MPIQELLRDLVSRNIFDAAFVDQERRQFLKFGGRVGALFLAYLTGLKTGAYAANGEGYRLALENLVHALGDQYSIDEIRQMMETGTLPPKTSEGTPVRPPEITIHGEVSFSQPFADPRANEEAEKLGVDAGSFFKFPESLLPKLRAFTESTEVLPIFAPSVMKWKTHIEAAAKKTNMPPTVLGAIVAIESQGLAGVASGVGAQGLTQVMPFNFPEDTTFEQMVDPDVNLETGAHYFMSTAHVQAKSQLGQLAEENPWDIRIVARAGMAYNAGLSGATMDWAELASYIGYFQTVLYSEYIVRYAIVAELADRLKSRGLTNPEIVAALSSPEIDARSAVLYQVSRGMSAIGSWDFNQYAATTQALANEDIPVEDYVDGYSFREMYDAYKHNPFWNMPLNPADRIYVANGGEWLFRQSSENYEMSEWLK